mgnify:FL=1
MSIQKIDAMLDNQVTEINALIGKETMQITHRHSNPMIAALTRKMSQHALDLFMVEFKAAKNVENSICECNFSTKYGIPCRHTIFDKMKSSGTFQSTDFHEHWMLQHETSSPAANVSSPRQKRLNSIQETLYSVDADQVPVLLQRLEEATSRPLHMLSNPVVSVVRKRGRPPGSKNRANQRDKSRFEYVSGNQCGNCGVNGHNSRTCPK